MEKAGSRCHSVSAKASKTKPAKLLVASRHVCDLTGDEILVHGRDWIVLEAMLLRRD